MKNLKRLFAVVLSIALVLCAVPMVAFAEIPTIPEMNTTYKVIDSSAGQWSSVTVPANAEMYSGGYRMADWNPKSFANAVLAKTEYIEMDVYVSSDVAAGAIVMWISNNWDDTSVRGRWVMPALTAGWNHVVEAVSNIGGNGGFNFNTYDVFNSRFWEGVASKTEDVTIAFGNVALTAENPTPDMSNEQISTVASVEGVFWSKAGIAGKYSMPPVGADNNASWYGHLASSLDITGAKYIELDIYSTVDVSTYIWISSAIWADAGRSAYGSKNLTAGWNHVCVPLSEFTRTSGTIDKTAVRNVFLEMTTPTMADGETVSLKMANLAFTTNVPTPPEMSNTYAYSVFSKTGVVWNWAQASGEAMNWQDCFYINNGGSIDITKAKYLEFDLYANVANTSFGIWLSTAYGDSPARRQFNITVQKGWNHIVIDLTQYVNVSESDTAAWDDTAVKSIFLQPFTPDTDYNYTFANIAFTTDVDPNPGDPDVPGEGLGTDPEVVPTPNYIANVIRSAAVDLKGSKNNTTDERYFNWQTYYEAFQPTMENPLNITKGNYIEFDFYSDVETTIGLAMGSRQDNPDVFNYGFEFFDNRSLVKNFDVKVGWNHIVLTTDGNYRKADPTTMQTYNAERVSGFVIRGCSSGYVRLTNIAVTRDIPVAESTYVNPIIDYADSQLGEKTFAADVTNIYNDPIYGYDARFFVALGKTIDVTMAEYIEFDLWVDAKMNDSWGIWICNSFDGSGRLFYGFDTSKLNINAWNHIVLDVKSYVNMSGTFDTKNWGSIYFEGDPNPDGIELTVKVANVGCSKSYPDMKNTHTLVKAAIDGYHKSATVPANTSMYSAYSCWGMWDPIDMSNVDFIELDIYVSDDIENSFLMHTAVDTYHPRGFWNVPALTKGWNHVVLDKVKDYGGSNEGMPISQLTSWSGTFFEGPLHSTKEITVKFANIAATKFAPDPNYTYIEVTSHPEIYGDVTTTGALDTENSFTAAVDFSKGDSIELDVYASEAPASDITVVLTNINGVEATLTLAAADVAEGWNHIVLDLAGIKAGEGFAIKSLSSIGFTGEALTAVEGADFRFAYANLALTAEEAVKLDMEYTGKIFSKFAGYSEITIPAAADISESATPIALPVAMDLTGIDYIEMNLYVSAKCDLVLNLNSTPADIGEIYTDDDGYYELSGLTYGWNQIHIPVADLVANAYFDPSAVTHIYFSGVPAATYDVTFTVEDLAVTSASLEFDIVEGDYNVDNAVDMRDLIHVVNASLAEEAVWFANAAEVKGADNGIIDASDITALRKLLFASF